MKKLFFIFCALSLVSCSLRIPMQTNISNQTLLITDNKPIKADYNLISVIPNGPIKLVTIQRNGREYVQEKQFEYASETAFKKMFTNYFEGKYNSFEDNVINIKIKLLDLYMIQKNSTSSGMTIMTGNMKYKMVGVAEMSVDISYKGETYTKTLNIEASEYNESQNTNYGTYSKTNPTMQRSLLLQSTFNRAIIKVDNMVSQVLGVNKNKAE